MIGDTLSDAVIRIGEYLEYGMYPDGTRPEIEKLVAEMDRVREWLDVSSLADIGAAPRPRPLTSR